jgi:hypothetical protein
MSLVIFFPPSSFYGKGIFDKKIWKKIKVCKYNPILWILMMKE